MIGRSFGIGRAMPKRAGDYAHFLKMASPSNPVASYYSARPFTAPAQSSKVVFPEFSAVYDSTISPGLQTMPVRIKPGPSWATGIPANRPQTRGPMRAVVPTSIARTSPQTHLTAKTAKRGTLVLPESICPGVSSKPKPMARPRGQVYQHHPHWVGL